MKRYLLTPIILIMLFLIVLSVPALASVLTIPSGTKVIEEEAFYCDKSLDEVVLPEGIEEIGPRAFANSSLKKINLPSTLKKIAYDSFIEDENIQVTATEGTFAYRWAVGNIWEKDQNAEKFNYTSNGDGTCTVTG